MYLACILLCNVSVFTQVSCGDPQYFTDAGNTHLTLVLMKSFTKFGFLVKNNQTFKNGFSFFMLYYHPNLDLIILYFSVLLETKQIPEFGNIFMRNE